MKKTVILLLAAILTTMAGCDSVNNKEVPSYVVNIDLGNIALWNTYGVTGVGDYRMFDRMSRIPANFPYNANTYTGYGGVLLMMGVENLPLAYDLACPVENQANVKVRIDKESLEAVCPQCKSRYNVLTGGGGPMSGQAYTNKYGLRMHAVHQSPLGGYIITSK